MTTYELQADEPLFFLEAQTKYRNAQNEYARLRNEIITEKGNLSNERESFKLIESETLVNSGCDKHPIDGKNSEIREAQLRICLANNIAAISAQAEVAHSEQEVARLEADMDDAANTMSVARRTMDYAVASVRRAAAIEANAGVEREDHDLAAISR